MNVLFVGIRENEEDITSGPKKVANILYNRLVNEHPNVFFYGLPWEDPGNQKSSKYEIINDYEAKGTLFNLIKFIKEKDIDVVYLARYYSLLAIFLVFLKFIYRFKLVYTVHGIIKKEKDINKSFKSYSIVFEYVLLKNSDSIVAITHALKDELIRCYPNLNKQKISIVNNGVEILPIKEKIDIRSYFDISNENNILFTVGTRRIKNIETLLENFISSSSLYEDSCLLIAGETDTEYAKYIIDKYRSYNKIRFIGSIDTNMMNNLYSECDLFIQISEFETFGLSIIEALLHKKNVVISSHLPIAEYFVDGEVSLYKRDRDNLKEIIINSLKGKEVLNEKGYEKVKSIFNWKNISKEYYKIFEETYNTK